MPETSDETQAAMAYPTNQQYGQWKEHADELDMSVSEFICSMVEAGRKKIQVDVEPDQTNQELREQRNDLKSQLDDARNRISRLENELHNSERQALVQQIHDNPGISYAELTQEIGESVPDRVTKLLSSLEGTEIRREDEGYYPVADK